MIACLSAISRYNKHQPVNFSVDICNPAALIIAQDVAFEAQGKWL